MDDERKTGLSASRRRKESEEQLLQWWTGTKSQPIWGPGSVKVRDKGDGFNRYGVFTGRVSPPSEGPEVVSEQRESETVYSGYTYIQRPTRRQSDGRRRDNRVGQSHLVR